MSMNDRVSRKEKYIFAAGDLYGGGAQLIIGFYYLIFLTDVVRIRPALAGTVILISKIWDAVSDPLMGVITDNTRTKWGRRKPYFLIGFFGILISFFFLWYPVAFEMESARFVYVLISYLFYSTIQTIVMVPYSAMSSEISNDYKERTVINGTRLFFSQFASLLCAVLPLEVVKMFQDERVGYMAMAATFAIFFAVPFILIFFVAKERVPVPHEKSKFDLSALLKPFRLRSFRILIAIYLFAFLAMDIVSTVFAYFMNYYLLRPDELNYVLGAMLITQIVLVPAVIKIATVKDKTFVLKYSVILWAIGAVLLGLMNTAWPVWSIYVIAVIIGAGIIGCVVMPWTMYPDVTDAGELAFGKRISGSFSGIMTFMRKFSSAIGIFIVSQILDIAGYIKPQDISENGVTKKLMMEQPETLITALKFIVIFFPLFLLGLVLFNTYRYPLNAAIHKRLRIQLDFQRGETEEGLDEQEVNEIRKKLIG